MLKITFATILLNAVIITSANNGDLSQNNIVVSNRNFETSNAWEPIRYDNEDYGDGLKQESLLNQGPSLFNHFDQSNLNIDQGQNGVINPFAGFANENGYDYGLKDLDGQSPMKLPFLGSYGEDNGYNNHQQSLESIPIGQHIDVTNSVQSQSIKHVPVPFKKPVHISVPYPVIVPVPQPYPVKVPVYKPVPVTVEKEYKVPVEKLNLYPVLKKVPIPVTKGVPYSVEKEIKVNVPQPYPVHIPVVKPIYHNSKGSSRSNYYDLDDHHGYGDHHGFGDFDFDDFKMEDDENMGWAKFNKNFGKKNVGNFGYRWPKTFTSNISRKNKGIKYNFGSQNFGSQSFGSQNFGSQNFGSKSNKYGHGINRFSHRASYGHYKPKKIMRDHHYDGDYSFY